MAIIPEVFWTHVAFLTPRVEKVTPIECVQNKPPFFS